MSRRKSVQSLTVKIRPDGGLVTVVGRDAWALDQLLRAGDAGCTPLHNPALRWSHYIFKLRQAGIVVETIHEEHGGPYAGTHGRYVLRSDLKVLRETSAVTL
ncbi:winged helix domain-containing protein [Phyllobacterium leguminum]|uniref:Winged helix domain-containing protein n=1 Tax=Phyllobacterium leguminum TaxID=314237 RepID=A0A318T6X5_9HYPH|nr:hypothetical protein [Phyllobacterium leguminum]PYE88777.1 hypothetical protein C7477_106150 [Phyllobacterium leguminum]